MALAERVARAAARPPLADCSAAQRAELERLLAEADEIEDLPGKWQAAIVAAESGAERAGGCCGGASAARAGGCSGGG